MSHFNVFVTGHDFEASLAPFYEGTKDPINPPESAASGGKIKVGSRVSFPTDCEYRWSVPRKNFYGIVEKQGSHLRQENGGEKPDSRRHAS